uniref:Nitric oxide synthase-interacting protein homolog n=1 Tax=Meloidogyne incognita TaxID=6306 RepID=A0A914NJP0_MELIC
MTRHAKNATAASVYTYHERRKDASVSGYGTLHERLGKDSMKSFDCCSLSLQPCREPLISPQGHIFDREAILNYILDQKEAYKRKLKVWEQQRRIDEEKIENALKKEKDKMKEKLIALESAPLPQKTQVPSTPDIRQLKRPQNDKMEGPSNSKKVFEEESISNMEGAKAKEWKSFWVPVLSTTAEPDRIEKPSNKILCPISGVELKFKELLPVKFTPIDERIEFSKLIAMNERYICPISRDVLTNSIRCVYLKTSKSVVCSPCMEKIIRLDMIDPLCGKSLQDSDIIELSRGGTGYAATNDLKAKLIRPQLELQ